MTRVNISNPVLRSAYSNARSHVDSICQQPMVIMPYYNEKKNNEYIIFSTEWAVLWKKITNSNIVITTSEGSTVLDENNELKISKIDFFTLFLDAPLENLSAISLLFSSEKDYLKFLLQWS